MAQVVGIEPTQSVLETNSPAVGMNLCLVEQNEEQHVLIGRDRTGKLADLEFASDV